MQEGSEIVVRDLHAKLLHDLARFDTGRASHSSGKHGGPCAAPGATSLALLQSTPLAGVPMADAATARSYGETGSVL